MSKYKVVTAHCVHAMLLQHTAFIAGVSTPAAKRFRDEFADVLKRLSENPFQFPPYEDPNLPKDVYRGAFFANWYKAVFSVSDNVVYLDAVIDCRAKSDTFWADK
ncbi:type II toxin-antitoxin system RelE/ParE family toxin [uncultured Oscillibacter sp.]|uniref:type II toxin-antitoxin system RelE/ParE family toxin n=2 Tax=Eubacteriales TaxID=186802 RepID=UPI00272AEB32|nr:hypothetical protein [uncultured Oscillibacter sp.]